MSNRAVMSSPEHKVAIKSERALFNEGINEIVITKRDLKLLKQNLEH